MRGGQQQSKMVSKISRSQDFIGISGFLWDFNLWISRFLWDLWDFYGIISVFYGNTRNKYIAWDFGSRIQARFQLGFQHLRPRFQLVADPSAECHEAPLANAILFERLPRGVRHQPESNTNRLESRLESGISMKNLKS